MKIKHLLCPLLSLALLFIVSFLFSPGITAQEKSTDAAKAVSDTVVILPIPTTELMVEYEKTAELISKQGKLQISDEDHTKFDLERDTILTAVDQFLAEDILQSMDHTNVRELDNARYLVDLHIDQIKDFQLKMTKRTRDIMDGSIELVQNRKRWELSKENAGETGIPDVVKIRMDQTIRKLDSVNSILQEDFTNLLIEENIFSGRNAQLKSLLDSISVKKQLIGESLYSADMPPLIQEFASKDTSIIKHHADQFVTLLRADVKLIKSRFKVQLWVISILLLTLVVLAFSFKKNYSKEYISKQHELKDIQLAIIESPVATVLFLTTLLIRFLFKEFFMSLQVVNLFFLMIPLIIVVLRSYTKKASPWIEILMGFYVLTYIYEVIFYSDILQRLLLLVMSTGGFVYYLMMVLRRAFFIHTSSKFLLGLIRVALAVIALLCFAAIFGNFAGAVRMAEYFTINFILLTILTLLIFVTTRVVNAVIYMLLAGKTLQGLNMVRDGIQVIHKKVTRLINLLLWVFFFTAALGLLNFKERFMEWGDETLNTGWTIGAVDITPANILIFIFVIWFSVFLSRIISTILEKDIFTRIPTAKGIPHTVTMLLRITLITGGFFLAAAAAGMELSNLSIIIGAFSVGIGFGLQNVFNNMVSGLILAFERPIKVGDTVQVGELMGVVLSIGFRASIVKSFDGAEVIVPNGNLISNSMINWTLTDYLRRMDIRVGVAYGTDPEAVLEILRGLAEEHEKVRKHPAPSAFFLGFGESSLDFRLLAWTDIDSRLTVESQLNVSLNGKLNEAGIEIPFPQHDLHVRSDDTKG